MGCGFLHFILWCSWYCWFFFKIFFCLSLFMFCFHQMRMCVPIASANCVCVAFVFAYNRALRMDQFYKTKWRCWCWWWRRSDGRISDDTKRWFSTAQRNVHELNWQMKSLKTEHRLKYYNQHCPLHEIASVHSFHSKMFDFICILVSMQQRILRFLTESHFFATFNLFTYYSTIYYSI